MHGGQTCSGTDGKFRVPGLFRLPGVGQRGVEGLGLGVGEWFEAQGLCVEESRAGVMYALSESRNSGRV